MTRNPPVARHVDKVPRSLRPVNIARSAEASPNGDAATVLSDCAHDGTHTFTLVYGMAAKKRPASEPAPAQRTIAKAPPKSAPYADGAWASVFAPRGEGERRYWLIKSEPESFSFEALQAAPGATTPWEGVRNAGARNFLRDGMKRGDLAFYYHSNAEPSQIVGIAEVVRDGYPDPSAFDPSSAYYDADSDPAHPAWFMVDVRAVAPLARPVPLAEIKAHPVLRAMALIRVGRLSVVPVEPHEWEAVLALSGTSIATSKAAKPRGRQ